MYLLIHGKNTFLSHREAKNRFKDLKESYPSYECLVIESERLEPSDIIQNIETTDMFSEGKNILIKRLYNNKEKKEITEYLIETIDSLGDSMNIILWEESKIPGNTRYLKYFKKQKSVLEIQDLNRRTFKSWAEKEIKREGLKAPNKIIYKISETSNYEPERFLNTLEKIKLSKAEEITQEVIEDYSVNTLKDSIWDLIDALNDKNRKQPIDILENLLDQREDPIFILSMIVRNTRSLLLCKSLLEKGKKNKEIASVIGIPPFTVPSIAKKARNTDYGKLKRLYHRLTNLDYQVKTGQIEPKLGITLLIAFSPLG
jgi:DNA polymerase-3 subunit delta